jgi:hypothetical protein
MEHEAPSRLDRSTMVDRAIGRFARIDVELLKQGAETHSGALMADSDADGAILVVDANGDHGSLEARVGHSGHCQQQLARQETRLVHEFRNEPQQRHGQALSRNPSPL